jgi:hypothetical protein
MAESVVPFYTPETKWQSKQWQASEDQSPCFKDKYFFDAKSVIYTNIVSKRETINASYIWTALARFQKVFTEKRPIMLLQERFLHWDNAPVHTTGSAVDFLSEGHEDDPPPFIFVRLHPVGHFPVFKGEARAGWPDVNPGELQEQLGGGCHDHGQGGLHHCLQAVDGTVLKCIWVGGNYVKKY